MTFTFSYFAPHFIIHTVRYLTELEEGDAAFGILESKYLGKLSLVC